MGKDNIPDTTPRDDSGFDASQDYQNFDDIPVPMGPMGIALGLEESLPEDDENLDSEDSIDEPEDTVDEDDTDQQDQELEEDEEDDSDSTQTSLPSEEEIDWDYQVPVKIDGELKHLTLSELRKGFATDQHLSKKGRDVSELEKSLKAEHQSKITQVTELGAILTQQLSLKEDGLSKEYHEIEKEISEARDKGETFDLADLKDKRETVQKSYWLARKERESLTSAVNKEQQDLVKEQGEQLLAKFNTDISSLVPDFNAEAVRDFALKEGIPQDLLDTLLDANTIKFIDDYRKLKEKSSSGAVKRKAKKAKGIPMKAGSQLKTKKSRQTINLRSKVLSGEGSEQDQLDFLKNLSKFR